MSETRTYKGTLTEKKDTQVFDSGFQKREVIICDDDPKYPNEVPFELVKDKVDMVDKIPLNSKVEVSYNIRGSYWEKGDRHFVSLNIWKIDVLEEGDGQGIKGQKSFEQEDAEIAARANSADETDDIPF